MFYYFDAMIVWLGTVLFVLCAFGLFSPAGGSDAD